MRTRKEQMSGGGLDSYRNFIGDDSEYQDWYGIIGQSRDSDCLEQSNFAVALELLGGESEDVRVERYGHWGCGWIEEIYVRPRSKAYDIAADIEKRLADYPVLNEEDFCERESEAANRVWRDCYSWRERADYVRRNRSQFDFHGLADMLACIRGDYFAGYASELLA